MKENVKVPGDHRIISDPIAERKDFIKHIKNNVEREEKSSKKPKSNEKK